MPQNKCLMIGNIKEITTQAWLDPSTCEKCGVGLNVKRCGRAGDVSGV